MVYIEATSENNLFTYQDNFVTNKLIFYNNHLSECLRFLF